jgi:hypothetical protein
MKKKIRVTIEKEIEIELPDNMLTPEYQAEFERSMWPYRNDDELFFYAAEMAARYGSGMQQDGLGLLSDKHSTYPRVPDVKFDITYENVESEPAN